MANPTYYDGGGNQRYRKVNGNTGLVGDPDVTVEHIQSIATGASADLTDMLTDLDSILSALQASLPSSLGQKTKANSTSVVLASDQDTIGLSTGSNTIGVVLDGGFKYTLGQGRVNIGDLTTPTDLTAAPASGQRSFIKALCISTSIDCQVQIIEQTSSTMVWGAYVKASEPLVITDANEMICADVADRKLIVLSPDSAACYIYCSYYSKA